MPYRNDRGFSLVEIAIVLVIIGIIAVIVIPAILSGIESQRRGLVKDDVTSLKNEIIGYAVVNKNLPDVLSALGRSQDRWGNNWQFEFDQDLADTGDICAGGFVDANDNLAVNLYKGDTQFEPVNGTAFVIWSPGPNRQNQMIVDNSTNPREVNLFQSGLRPTGTYGSVTLTGGEPEIDDVYEYVTTNALRAQVCTGSASQFLGGPTAPTGADVVLTAVNAGTDFVDEGSAGTGNVRNNGDGSITLGEEATADADNPDGEGDTSTCLWYNGVLPGNYCDGSGDCEFRDGLRAFFMFNSTIADTSADSDDRRGGLIFAMITSTGTDGGDNDLDSCGRHGPDMGYADYRNVSEFANRVQFPKIGVELDYQVNAGTAETSTNDKGDPATGNHLALVTWGSHPNNLGGDQDPQGGVYYWNTHNMHGSGRNPASVFELSALAGGNETGYEDARTHWIRLEVERWGEDVAGSDNFVVNCFDLPADCNANDGRASEYYVWVWSGDEDEGGSAASDLSTTYRVPLAAQYLRIDNATVNMPSFLDSLMSNVQVGFTYGNNQNDAYANGVNIFNFGINFGIKGDPS